MKAIKWLLVAVTTLGLIGCAFDKNQDNDTQRELEDNAALLERFARVTGLYNGTVTTGSGQQQVELSFYPYYRKIGQNANGEDRYKPELRARYRRLDTVVADVIMTVRFYEETAQLLMTNSDEAGAATVININANLNGDLITGNVSQNNFPLGSLNARLTTREYKTPNPNDQAERNQRLRELYDTITGMYSGTVTPRADLGDKYAININLYYVDELVNNVYTTVLKAHYTLPSDPEGGLEAVMNVDYLADTQPPTISMVSYGGSYVGKLSLAGTISKGEIRGNITNERNRGGAVYLKKQK